MVSNVGNTMVQSPLMPDIDSIGFAVGIASISQLLAKLQVLPVYACFLAAILKIVMMAMSLIRSDCTTVFTIFETMDLAVRIVSISQLLAKFKVLPVYAGFLVAILKIGMMSMSLISAGCTIVFPALENIGFAVGIASNLNYWQSYKHFQLIPFAMVAILNFLLILV